MRFLRIMSENDDRTEERSREGKEPEEEEVVGEEVVGGGEGTTADEDGVAEGVGGGEGAAAAEDGVEEAVGPSSYTNQEVNDMPPDQAIAAVTRGLLTSPQMQRLLGGPSLTPKGLLRALLLTKAAAEANAVEAAAAVAAKAAAEEAKAVAEAKAAAEAKGCRGRGCCGAAAEARLLRRRPKRLPRPRLLRRWRSRGCGERARQRLRRPRRLRTLKRLRWLKRRGGPGGGGVHSGWRGPRVSGDARAGIRVRGGDRVGCCGDVCKARATPALRRSRTSPRASRWLKGSRSF